MPLVILSDGHGAHVWEAAVKVKKFFGHGVHGVSPSLE